MTRFGTVALCAPLWLAALAAPAAAQGPDPAALSEPAPATFKARFETSKGAFVIEVHRDWAPNGADRFYNLVKSGYFDGVRFFRVVSGFMVQFGIHGDPRVSERWRGARIKDDPVRQSNRRGYVTYATSGPDSRTTAVFINFADNSGLDREGFAPFGRVIAGMDVVDSFYAEYGDAPPRGRGPDQRRVHFEGNVYLEKEFPRLDYIRKATLEP
jgi:peptidyl-prolyl cis-trans isomerase A (cyclophilin A)